MKINNCPICNENKFISTDYLKAPKQDEWTYDCFKNKSLSTCKKCHFTFTVEVFENGALSKFYNSLYTGNKLKEFKSSENYEFAMRFMSHINFIRTNIDLWDGMNILEIGPNENGMIPTFSLFCKSNYFYFEQVEYPVINEYGGIRLGKYFSRKTASLIEFDKKIDLIVLSHCLEHFEPQNINQDIESMSLALKLNGCVSVEVPLESSMSPPHTQSFNVNNMSLLFEKHGFEIVASQSINKPNGMDKNELINKPFIASELVKEFFKKIISLLLPRRIRLMILKPFYQNKLKVLYDGKPYMRLLAQKKLI